MKKARLLLAVLALSMTAGACSSITAPDDCKDNPEECQIIPGPDN